MFSPIFKNCFSIGLSFFLKNNFFYRNSIKSPTSSFCFTTIVFGLVLEVCASTFIGCEKERTLSHCKRRRRRDFEKIRSVSTRANHTSIAAVVRTSANTTLAAKTIAIAKGDGCCTARRVATRVPSNRIWRR